MKNTEGFHLPVLAKESADFVVNDSLQKQVIIDGTLGGGGYSILICDKLSTDDMLIGIDKDFHALEYAKERLKECRCNTKILHGNFGELKRVLNDAGVDKITGLVLDLGLSSYQIEHEDGFSYRKDTLLDMRADKTDTLTAADVLNSYTIDELVRVFEEYSEIGNSIRLAKAVFDARKTKKFETTFDAVAVVRDEYKINDRQAVKFLSKIFQALRIEVNAEMQNLENVLKEGEEMLEEGGRFVIVSYHSLEDRMVKNYFKEGSFKVLTKKCVMPHYTEVRTNSRARSAKLRAAQKL